MQSQDLYAILGVERSASQSDIKKAFRSLAKKTHPDVNPGNAKAEERFKAISVAGEILGDPERRKLYDEFGDASLRSGFDAKAARAFRSQGGARGGGNWSDLFAGGAYPQGSGFDFGGRTDFSSIFDELMGNRRGRRPRRGADLESEVTLDLVTAISGGERELTLTRPEGPSRLKVKIPTGIADGQVIRLAGQGEPGDQGPAGDLLMHVHVTPHPHLRRDGDDLHLDLPITVAEAMLGAEIKAPTPTGTVTVKVPPGSQSGRQLRLRGKGVPAHAGREAGDLYYTLVVHVPAAEDEQARAAAQTLTAFYPTDIRAGVKL